MDSDGSNNNPALTAMTSLRRFVRPRATQERCELCDAPLGPQHDHLLELANRRLNCACEACAILFSNQAVMGYRRVPRRIRSLADFRLSDETWEGLRLPINLAFFV